MTDQNPDQPGQPGQPGQPSQPDRPENPGQPQDDRPQYGIRLTPEQQAEHQARLDHAQQAREAQQGQRGQQGQQNYPAPPYGQPPQEQFQQGQSPYGQAPYGQPGQQPYGYPNPGAQQLGPIERPKTIDRSYWLILAAGAVFLITELIALFSPNMGLSPEMMDLYQEQMYAAGVQIEMESFLDSVRIFALVFTAILAALYWLIATGIRRGSNVARIFGTIFAVFSLLSAFGPGFIYVALGVAGIIFAYLRPSSEYFRAKAWEKAMRR